MLNFSRQQKSRQKKRNKLSIAFAFDLFIIAVIATVFCVNSQTFAATHNITGGTYGSSCNSGGYFTPSSLMINSGDTVTISVPSNDPYAGGLEVHGFPEGNFTIPRGGQHTTQALTSSVSYHGTWPSTGCLKGSGTITVSNPTPPPPPPPPPSPTPTPSPSPSSHPSPTPTPTPSASTSNSASNPTSKPPSPAPAPSPSKTSTTSPKGSAAPDNQPMTTEPTVGAATQSAAAVDANAKSSSAGEAAGLAGGIVVVGAAGWVVWRFVIKK